MPYSRTSPHADPSVHDVSELPRTAEVVVIGGGIVGAASAFYAARAGLHPIMIERRPRLCTLTTPAATGAFRLQFDNREEMEMIRRSVEVFLNFEAVTEQRDYRAEVKQPGYLWPTTRSREAYRGRAGGCILSPQLRKRDLRHYHSRDLHPA